MKCNMQCTKRAKLKISTSYGVVQCLCYRHAWGLLKHLIKDLRSYGGIYIQRPPESTAPWKPAEEARHAITMPEDRERKQEVLAVFDKPKDDDWDDF